jgi:hypothetical protein
MGKTSNLSMQIEQMLRQGIAPEKIAQLLEIPVLWVQQAQQCMNELTHV